MYMLEISVYDLFEGFIMTDLLLEVSTAHESQPVNTDT